MFGDNSSEEAVLYYLYMMADGNISYSEEKIFNELCGKLHLSVEAQKEAIKKCRDITSNMTDIFRVIVKEKIDDQAGRTFYGLRHDSSLARIIWNLVCLGYADSGYSQEEKKIVEYLIDKWSVKPEVYQEFIDIADTMLALTKQKRWLDNNFSVGAEKDKKEKEIDIEMKRLLDDVKLTIDEIMM